MTDVLEREIHLDGPRLRRVESFESLVWNSRTSHRTRMPERQIRQAAETLRCDLVVLDSSDRKRAKVPVAFDRWLSNGATLSFIGADPSGMLRLTLTAHVLEGRAKLNFKFSPRDEVAPSQLLPLVSWFRHARTGASVGLWLPKEQRWLADPKPIDEPERIPPGYVDVIRALARVEQRSGQHLMVPSSLDARQVEQIEIADRLVRGISVVGTWSSAELNEDEQMREVLMESDHGVQMQFTTEYQLHLGDRSVPIGDVQYTLAQAHLSNADDGTGPIKLVAGMRDGLTIKLQSVGQWTNADGSTSWVPASMLEPYEDRWIAQSGTTVLQDAETRRDVVSGLRASGLRGTILRVPQSEDSSTELIGPAS